MKLVIVLLCLVVVAMAYEEQPTDEQVGDYAPAPKDSYGQGRITKYRKKEGYGHGLRGRRSVQGEDVLETADHRNDAYRGGYSHHRGGSGHHHRGSYNYPSYSNYPRGYGYHSG